MADAIPDRIPANEQGCQSGQVCVLDIGEGPIIGPLEFDTDGKVVTATATVPFGLPGMPGTKGARHELQECTVAADEEVAGDSGAGDLPIVRVRVRVKAVSEQIDDAGAAELTGWQADIVYDQQFDGRASRSVVEIREGM